MDTFIENDFKEWKFVLTRYVTKGDTITCTILLEHELYGMERLTGVAHLFRGQTIKGASNTAKLNALTSSIRFT